MAPDNFRHAVEAFMKKHSMSATRFGVYAAGDTKFVKTLRDGRNVRETTQKTIRDWMRSFEKGA